MKLLIISDTHGLKDEIFNLVKQYPDYLVLHLGDYCIKENVLEDLNIIYVNGNCDLKNNYIERIIEIDNTKIFMTHGHKYNVKSTFMNIYYKALMCNANYCLFGHTHNETMFVENNITFVNPGSLKYNKSYVLIEEDKVLFKRL